MVNLKKAHLSYWLGTIALAAFIAGCADESGTVVDVGDDEITVADGDDSQDRTTYRVSPETDVTVDGDSGSLPQIQPGDEVDITLDDDAGGNVASDIDVTSPDDADVDDDADVTDDLTDNDLTDENLDDDFENPIIAPPTADSEPVALEGSVSAVHEESLMVHVETEEAEDNEVEVIVDDNTEITLDGVSAEFGDILPGFTVLVSADDVDGRLHGDRIEATSTDTAPPPVTEPEVDGIDDLPIDSDGGLEDEDSLPEEPDPQP